MPPSSSTVEFTLPNPDCLLSLFIHQILTTLLPFGTHTPAPRWEPTVSLGSVIALVFHSLLLCREESHPQGAVFSSLYLFLPSPVELYIKMETCSRISHFKIAQKAESKPEIQCLRPSFNPSTLESPGVTPNIEAVIALRTVSCGSKISKTNERDPLILRNL